MAGKQDVEQNGIDSVKTESTSGLRRLVTQKEDTENAK